jgi:uncharacterized protein (UPF0276 family)
MTAAADLGLGLGWRPEVSGLALARRDLGFVEVIAESLPARAAIPAGLDVLQARGAAVVPHGIGLSLGGAERLDRSRVAALAGLATRLRAPLVSEHAAFVRAGRREAGNLLPVPRTRAALRVLAENIRVATAELPVPLAVENPASTFEWPDNDFDEADFLTELVDCTGCRLLLDLANLHVNSRNHRFDPLDVLDRLPLEQVAYVHVAGGHCRDGLLHDTHAHPLWPEVVGLVEELAARSPIAGLLLERDDRFPPRAQLSAELDLVQDAWRIGDGRRTPHPRVRAAPRTADHCRPRPADRRALRSDQGSLVAALVAGALDPPGFPPDRLDAAREALLAKRTRATRSASPARAAHRRGRRPRPADRGWFPLRPR